MITCNEDNIQKATQKYVKHLVFKPPFGDLGVTHSVHLSIARWKAYCRLSISDNRTLVDSSHGRRTIKRNLSKYAFSKGLGHFERKFWVDGDVACNTYMDS